MLRDFFLTSSSRLHGEKKGSELHANKDEKNVKSSCVMSMCVCERDG